MEKLIFLLRCNYRLKGVKFPKEEGIVIVCVYSDIDSTAKANKYFNDEVRKQLETINPGEELTQVFIQECTFSTKITDGSN